MDDLYVGMNNIEVALDPSEVRLIMRALDCLRYSEESAHMNGSQLVNLAGLSMEWRGLTQDIAAHRYHGRKPEAVYTSARREACEC